MQWIVQQIQEIVANGVPRNAKMIIGSNYTTAIDLIAKTLDKYLPHMNYEKVDGSVRKRNDLILRFQLNPTVRILIVNNKIGGQGLNLMQTPSLTLTVGTTKSSLISSLDALGDPDKSTQCLPTSSFATTRLTCISSNCALTSARTLKSSGRVQILLEVK